MIVPDRDPAVIPPEQCLAMNAAMALINSEAGGYTETIILFVFMEPWRGIGRPIAIILAYTLCLAGDTGSAWCHP